MGLKRLERIVQRGVAAAMLLLSVMSIGAQEVIENVPPKDSIDSIGPIATIDSIAAIAPIDTLELNGELDSLSLTARVDSLTARARELMQRRDNFQPDPKRALWLALIIPGGGQIYNRKYWKLPIVYGGFLGCYYALSWNNQMLRDYSQAYLDIMDDDPNTKSYEKMLPMNYNISGRESQFKEIFKNKKNYYRKYRDMSILAFAVVYAIAVIDAYVDAELSSFDISEDLSLEWAPAVISNNPAGRGASPVANPSPERGFGVGLRLKF